MLDEQVIIIEKPRSSTLLQSCLEMIYCTIPEKGDFWSPPKRGFLGT